MVTQYPHFLYVREVPEAVMTANGSFKVKGESVWVLKGVCREESNGRASTVSVDGRAYVFSSLIQMPLGVERVTEGSEVLVTTSMFLTDGTVGIPSDDEGIEEARREGLVRIYGTCAKFDCGQMHNRMWL